jgi:hypothetical protein
LWRNLVALFLSPLLTVYLRVMAGEKYTLTQNIPIVTPSFRRILKKTP